MSLWDVRFFPPSGNRNSPEDYIYKVIPLEADQVSIVRWLQILSHREISDWPNTKIHKLTGDIFQLTVGKYRLSFVLDVRRIIVLHCCPKKGQKTKKIDLQRAELNYKDYLASRE